MTLWQFITNVFNLVYANITKLLGFAQVTVAFLTTSNVIPADDLKYWIAAMGLLTVWRGFATPASVAEAKSKSSLSTMPPEAPKIP